MREPVPIEKSHWRGRVRGCHPHPHRSCHRLADTGQNYKLRVCLLTRAATGGCCYADGRDADALRIAYGSPAAGLDDRLQQLQVAIVRGQAAPAPQVQAADLEPPAFRLSAVGRP